MPSTASTAAAVPTFRFATAAFPARERLCAWREVFGRTVVKLDIEPLEPARFCSEATICALPGLGVLFASSSAVHFSHPRDLTDDAFSFMAAPTGKWTASQLGRNLMLDTGDGVLMTNTEVGSMTLGSDTPFTTFRVPAAAIAPLVPHIEEAVARRIPAESEALQLLTRYLDVFRDPAALATPELQRLAETHVYDLLALALGATREAAEVAAGRGVRVARLAAIKADIMANLGRSDLTVEAVAARQRLTPRYVQMLFEETGTTFTQFVLGRRLARAHWMLSDPRLAVRPVAMIAAEAGFRDMSYFNRCFRRRFGASPSDLRSGRRGTAGHNGGGAGE